MRSFIRCLDDYLDYCQCTDQSSGTVAGKSSRLNLFIRWCLANEVALPADITSERLEAYRRYLYKEHRSRSGNPIDVATRRNHLTNVLGFLRWLKRTGVISIDPSVDFELPRVPRRLSQVWLTTEEASQVVQRADLYGPHGIRDRAVLETLFATGIRRMEVVGLDIADVDFKERTVKIRRGKGGNDRYVPIAKRACIAIHVYLTDVRPRLATLISGDALFLDNRGRRYPVRRMSRLVKQYVARAGVTKKGACNLYRHSTATLMLKGGADIRHVQEMLGHADISTTQIYTHVEISSLKDVYSRTHPANEQGADHGK